jgi:hypothetical protein
MCVCGEPIDFCRCGNFVPLTAPTAQKREARQRLSDAEADAAAARRRAERNRQRFWPYVR